MKFGTPPPQDVIFGKKYFGGGGCVKGVGYNGSYLFNLITPTYGKVGDF